MKRIALQLNMKPVYIALELVRYCMSIIILSLLLGCASIPKDAPIYKRVPEPGSNNANIYIYRLDSIARSNTVTVSLDGVPIFKALEGSYTIVTTPAGPHTIKIDWPWGAGPADLEGPITAEAGGSMYIKIRSTVKSLGSDSYAMYFSIGSFVYIMQQEEAEEEMSRSCRYIQSLSPQQLSDYAPGYAAGQQMAIANINGRIWFVSGFLLPLPTYIIARISNPEPPSEVLGKSSEYVAGYIAGYRNAAKEVRETQACTGGCCLFPIALSIPLFLYLLPG
jgi:hypothetical protein